MVLDELELPIVLAPLAGGPSTPALVAAVCEAGAFGFLASGYLTPAQLEEQLREVRSRARQPFGVNVFTPAAHPSDPAVYAPYVEEIRRWAGERGLHVGQPAFDDDGFAEKVELLVRDPAAVVSFTFGLPSRQTIGRLHDAGSEVWVTVTTPSEAALAIDAGADALVVQGGEAGGHRGSFDDGDAGPARSLLSLLQLLADAGTPLIAAGGLMSGSAIAAALAAGARAAQLGTAFLLCPEAGTAAPHRDALREAGAPTRMTRAFTGRAARGIVNPFMDEHDNRAVSAYPEIHHLTAPLRREARARGDGSMINLWAGEAYPLARELPAGELVRTLATEAGIELNATP